MTEKKIGFPIIDRPLAPPLLLLSRSIIYLTLINLTSIPVPILVYDMFFDEGLLYSERYLMVYTK